MTRNQTNRPPGEDGQRTNWRQFERLFDELFPNAVPPGTGDSIARIGQFVRGVMERAVPETPPYQEQTADSGQSALFQPHIGETERYLKVRIRIPGSIDPRKLQLFVNGLALVIEGPLGHSQTVPLPVPVGVKTMQAAYRDGTLHIRLTKRTPPPYKELYVQYP
ncbi:Hsp20/alpha crystallin family protein [Paenibacillus hodogayensis]|uniref:Hsp20/alpha crystallin family protein n=1 Tax=Paenibacillus hodogayensis TaxID=279208 RepID=A0ABV5W574_9BACL